MTAIGITLLLVGAILVAVEAHVPRLGVLGGPGVIALAAGALLAVGGLGGGLAVGLATALGLAAVGAGILAVTLRKSIAVGRQRARSCVPAGPADESARPVTGAAGADDRPDGQGQPAHGDPDRAASGGHHP